MGKSSPSLAPIHCELFLEIFYICIDLEVLETTRNFTEAALKRGGFYSPEGFPFQKHVTSRSSAWAMPTSA
jgi:hypothetical protein